MKKYIINGGRKLAGSVTVSGAKNVVLPAIIAACLSSETVEIKNVPLIADFFVMLELVKEIGGTVKLSGHTVKGEKVDTGLRSLGTVIGSNVMIGERVSTMPGIIIGNNVHIGPSTTVMKNVDSNTIFYTKFSEFVKKNSPSLTELGKRK